jgi:hypothetical protein
MASDVFGTPIGQTQTTTSGIASYATPYITNLLDKAQTAANTPYTAYSGPRVAGLSGLENQALGGIGNLRAFNPTQYQTQSWNTPGVMQSFMSPYQQGVTDIASREANRQADIQQTQLGKAGADTGFGDRFRLVQAEGERNRNQMLNDIQTRGLQSAYTAGQGQFNTENLNNLKMQEAQNAANLQGYNTGVSGLLTQLNAGALPRGIQQQGYDTGFQDWQTQQAYPWKQIQNMQQALSGLPISSSTQKIDYDSPSKVSQIAGGGAAAAALYKLLGNDSQGNFKMPDWLSGLFK